ncbi:MAG: nitroreductase family protein [Deltaproteobacteria bacterium]|nr:nitroreductase family protein [Deltaproteobacteria bacterium]
MVDLSELEKLIKTRRSIRKWKPDPVDVGMIRQAMELACWAPNGGNQQTWMYRVVQNRDIIIRMADAVRKKAETVASWPQAATVGPILERYVQNADFFRGAPVVVAALAGQYTSPMDLAMRARGESDPECFSMVQARQFARSSVQSVAAAVTYLCLIFHQMGLGAVWMSGPLIAKNEIQAILKIPEGYDLVALVPVGYPAESPPVRERKPLDEVMSIIS